MRLYCETGMHLYVCQSVYFYLNIIIDAQTQGMLESHYFLS